jgi:hypothetical protein
MPFGNAEFAGTEMASGAGFALTPLGPRHSNPLGVAPGPSKNAPTAIAISQLGQRLGERN